MFDYEESFYHEKEVRVPAKKAWEIIVGSMTHENSPESRRLGRLFLRGGDPPCRLHQRHDHESGPLRGGLRDSARRQRHPAAHS